jgi:hypothetical protein
LSVAAPAASAAGATDANAKLSSDHINDPAPPAGTELNMAVGEGEESVVAASANTVAGMEMGAVLADNDLPGLDGLAAKQLHTQALSIRITTVPGGRRALLVCHFVRPS